VENNTLSLSNQFRLHNEGEIAVNRPEVI